MIDSFKQIIAQDVWTQIIRRFYFHVIFHWTAFILSTRITSWRLVSGWCRLLKTVIPQSVARLRLLFWRSLQLQHLLSCMLCRIYWKSLGDIPRANKNAENKISSFDRSTLLFSISHFIDTSIETTNHCAWYLKIRRKQQIRIQFFLNPFLIGLLSLFRHLNYQEE